MSLSAEHRERLQDDEYLVLLHNKVLEDNRDFLCRNGTINPRHHYSYLRSKGILNREICEEINHVVGPTARANRFIDELQRNGGPQALTCFLQSLQRDGTQIFVLKRLNKDLENLLHNPSPMIPQENTCNCRVDHPRQSREFEESSIASEGDVSTSLLDEELQVHSPKHPLRPGDPGAPPLPSFEILAKCIHSQVPSSEEPEPSPQLTEH